MNKKFITALFILVALVLIYIIYKKWMDDQKNAKDNQGIKTKDPVTKENTKNVSHDVISPNSNITKFPLHQGSRGNAVKMLQVLVGLNPDGIWGPKTNSAILNKYNTAAISENQFAVFCLQGLSTSQNFPIQFGSTGNHVKAVQIVLGLPVSGKFDSSTENKLEGETSVRTLNQAAFAKLISEKMGINFVSYLIS